MPHSLHQLIPSDRPTVITHKMTTSSRLSDSLQRFSLHGIDICDTGITVGDGAYATVLQYKFRGLKCVGKKIHCLQALPAQRANMMRRFEEECELLCNLHHPNVVQFLGIHVEAGSDLPVLVTEYLPRSLSEYLDRHGGALPADIGCGILRDVALGLRYLHECSPPIIHRNLSANNILLTASLSAKISDLGMAKILNITPFQMIQQMSTKAPCYMPPEALVARPSYTRKIDIYSFGVLVLHVLCGVKWPFPTDPFGCDPVPDQRAEFLQKMGSDHPLFGLVHQCLSNAPDERPESADILQQINAALSRIPAPAETVFQQLEDLRSENQKLETEIENLENENQTLHSDVQRLEAQNQNLMSEIQTLREHSQTQPPSFVTSMDQPLRRNVERPSVLHLDPPVKTTIDSTESQFHPGVRLQWKRCADVPAGMACAQAVVIGEKVYVGGGYTADVLGDDCQVYLYNRRSDTWSSLIPRCPVRLYGMAHFMGRIVTVGGKDLQGSLTGKIHALREESQQWEEFLTPMPTARCFLSVATTSDAIVAAGGDIGSLMYSSTVEVYSSATSQWHAADPLPIPCVWMSSVTIDNTCYLLGGIDQGNSAFKNCWYTFLPSLIQRAVTSTVYSTSESVWNHLPPTPLSQSTAATLSGFLVAVGGRDDGNTRSSVVYTFFNNWWARLKNGDLLSPQSACATAQLSQVEVIVIGGIDETEKLSKTVFIGTLNSQ